MRAWHLLALQAAGKQPLRYHPPDATQLFLPSWLPKTDREILIAFYEQIIADRPLRRIEVDWYRSLLRADQAFLQAALRHHGAEEHLVVVKIRGENVDLHEVLRQPALQAFERLVVAADNPVKNDNLGGLLALSSFVRERIEELYEDLAEELDLRRDGVALVSTLVQSLINPISIVETFNALVDVQAEDLPRDAQQDAVHQRVIGRLLDELPGEELVVLAGVLTKWPAELSEALGQARQAAEEALRSRALLLDGRLNRWARWLEDPKLREVLLQRLEHCAAPKITRGAAFAAQTLRLDGKRRSSRPIRPRVLQVFRLINEGLLERAEEELSALQGELQAPEVTDETRGDYWQAVGRLRARQARWAEAEPSHRKALQFLEKAPSTRRSIMLGELAQGLSDNGRWPEAEPLFHEALRLAEEGGASPTIRGITLDLLARGLMDNGRWDEAEPLFREALRLQEEGGDSSTSKGITLHELARGLCDNGRWPEAEPLFREALRLKEEGGASPTSKGTTLHELARGLRDNGRWPEAEPLFREALRLKEEGGASLISRGITLHELARGLRDNGRWTEAEPLFREALRFKEEGRDSSISRGFTYEALARGLMANGRWAEAEPLFREALRLKKEGGASLDSQKSTLRALAGGLRAAGREAEADELLGQGA